LVAADIDGTLLGANGELSARTIHVIARLREAGIAFTLATSRRYTGTAPVAEALAHTGPLILYDGAQIRRFPGGAIEESDGLDVCVAREAADAIHRHHLRAIVQFSDEAGERLRIGPPGVDSHHDAEYLSYYTPQTSVVPIDELVLDAPLPLRVLAFGPLEALERAAADLAGSRGVTQVLLQGNYGAAELTVFSPTASKGNALLRLAKRLDIPRERTFAIGDGLNDISMLRLAGLGVAMGNANATVRAVARAVAGSVDEDGAALAIERYCLR
jgi:hypothetical protein